jgi:hypothetical protein
MPLLSFDPADFVPIMIFAIPIVAIVGGITAGVVKILSRHRLAEFAARERIAAIERGVDPSKLPSPADAGLLGTDEVYSPYNPFRRYQGLLIAGIVTLFAGIGVGLFLYFITDEPHVWAVGLVPALTGLGLLLSAWVVKPRGGSGAQPPAPGR